MAWQRVSQDYGMVVANPSPSPCNTERPEAGDLVVCLLIFDIHSLSRWIGSQTSWTEMFSNLGKLTTDSQIPGGNLPTCCWWLCKHLQSWGWARELASRDWLQNWKTTGLPLARGKWIKCLPRERCFYQGWWDYSIWCGPKPSVILLSQG